MKYLEFVEITAGTQRKYEEAYGWIIDLRLGPVYAGEVEGKTICLFGFTSPWKGLAEMWLVPLDGFETCVDAGRKFRDVAHFMQVRHGYRRLQACVDATIPRNSRSLEYMGFKKEAVLTEYGPDGQDFIMYRR